MATKTNEVRPHAGPQEAFLATSADIAIYGGAAGGGKTWALLVEPLRHVHRRRFGAVIFRRLGTYITQEGGLWDESTELYTPIGATPRLSPKHQWTFPSGARVTFDFMQYEFDKYKLKGAQIALLGIDQLEEFTEGQFFYAVSRLRSQSGVRPYARATANPDPDSWLAGFIAWWIDQDTGYPITERSGVVRWFIRDGDDIVWGDSPEELTEGRDPKDTRPMSVTFIPANLDDNPAVDPDYRRSLLALQRVDRERLLGGNWKIRPSAGDYFQRSWFRVIDTPPADAERVRAWDLAATEKEREKDDPDWTVGLRVARTPAGRFVVEHMERGQVGPHDLRQAVKNLASSDGRQVAVRLPQDPGQAGKVQARDYVSMLAGYRVRTKPVTGSKTVRAGPASSQAEAGNIDVVRGAWNDAFFTELEAFPKGAHDDIVDALSDAVDELTDGAGERTPSAFPGMDDEAIEAETQTILQAWREAS